MNSTIREYSSVFGHSRSVEDDQAQSKPNDAALPKAATEPHPQEAGGGSKKEWRKRTQLDISALLSEPTWSVRSLLPDQDKPIPPSEVIDQKKLHHLLRLSALPYPKDEAEEKSMIDTLHSQLHFVRDIQSVNTDGVEPLMSIRDETEEGIKEATITMDSLKEAFGREEIVGSWLRRPRRKVRAKIRKAMEFENWDPLVTASEVVERGGEKFFVVRSGKVEEDSDEPNPAAKEGT